MARAGEYIAFAHRKFGGQAHLDAVLVLERSDRSTPANGPAGAGCGVRAFKILDLREVVHVAPRTDLGDAEIDDAQALDRERILLTLVLENAVSPAHAYPDRDGLTFERDLPVRSLLRRYRAHPHDEGHQA